MRSLLVLAAIAAMAWYGYQHHVAPRAEESGEAWDEPAVQHVSAAVKYSCDGRTYCSQMHSCEEATFFLRNCPETKMDGNNDGVPCERQWCR
ncbi:excalibur calcium-binding domain-containing protein [Solimonas variicoloris]|uniref:excalibur calcium-binding domain-containing protein n=1 Tax=Solimonas variicoloris TaxID=254408 RepID=UPI0009FC8F0A|nr:excalibur calcium-binding domain-containing protein [Solimonas variicoloris]